MMSMKSLGVLLVATIAITQAYPYVRSNEVPMEDTLEEEVIIVPVVVEDIHGRRPILRDAASFAVLRQLRSEDYVPLSRRFRGILNSASRPDESGLNSDAKLRGSNSPSRASLRQPVVTNEEYQIEESQQLNTQEDSYNIDEPKVRAKKSERSFKYLPMRG